MVYFYNDNTIDIKGIMCAVPKNKVYVKDFEKEFGKDIVERFIKNTGINKLHRTLDMQTASDLGYEAAEKLIKNLNIPKKDIGLLIFITQSPDYRKPATACILQKRLNLSLECAAFDINLGCSAFVYGNEIIQSLLKNCDKKYGLLIISETSSKLAAPNDTATAMMFGDAGAAIVYERRDKNIRQQSNPALLMTDGNRFKSIIVPAGGFRDMHPQSEYYIASDGKKHSKYYSFMDGVGVFTFAVTDVVESIKIFLSKYHKKIEDYDYVLLHQANNLIIKQIAHKLLIPKNKLLYSLREYGNTSGVSIPLTIANVLGNKNEGEKNILAVGYGIGLSWGVTDLFINTDNIFNIIETDKYYDEGIIK